MSLPSCIDTAEGILLAGILYDCQNTVESGSVSSVLGAECIGSIVYRNVKSQQWRLDMGSGLGWYNDNVHGNRAQAQVPIKKGTELTIRYTHMLQVHPQMCIYANV